VSTKKAAIFSGENGSVSTRIDLSVLFDEDQDWLHNRNIGMIDAKKKQELGGLVDVNIGSPVLLNVPLGKGITKSYFEGYLLELSKRYLQESRAVGLFEQFSLRFVDEHGLKNDLRVHQTQQNFRYALEAITKSWQRETALQA